MKITLLFACLLIGGLIAETISARMKRSSRGEPIPITGASFFVSIKRRIEEYEEHWHHVCGGAFISRQHVLTAAHCIYDEKDLWIRNTVVVSGTDEDGRGGTEHSLQDAFPPPGFGAGKFSHNIAVIKLQAEVEWNEMRSPILLPSAEPDYEESATLISFQTMLNPGTGAILNQLQLVLFTTEECFGSSLPSESNLMFCGVAGEHQSMSSADSGAPLIYNGTVIGVVSWMVPPTDRARYFTNVYQYLPFINDALSN